MIGGTRPKGWFLSHSPGAKRLAGARGAATQLVSASWRNMAATFRYTGGMTKQRATRIEHLVTRTGRASSWRSEISGDTMRIYHYATLMAEVRNGVFTQVSEGWGSMSDKCGLAKLRRGAIAAGVLIA